MGDSLLKTLHKHAQMAHWSVFHNILECAWHFIHYISLFCTSPWNLKQPPKVTSFKTEVSFPVLCCSLATPIVLLLSGVSPNWQKLKCDMGREFTRVLLSSGDSFTVILNQQPATKTVLQKKKEIQWKGKGQWREAYFKMRFLKNFQKNEVYNWKRWTLENPIFHNITHYKV